MDAATFKDFSRHEWHIGVVSTTKPFISLRFYVLFLSLIYLCNPPLRKIASLHTRLVQYLNEIGFT